MNQKLHFLSLIFKNEIIDYSSERPNKFSITIVQLDNQRWANSIIIEYSEKENYVKSIPWEEFWGMRY